MPLLTIILTLVVVGVALYLINKYVPMQPSIKNLLNIAVIILLALWLLKVLGFWDYMKNVVL